CSAAWRLPAARARSGGGRPISTPMRWSGRRQRIRTGGCPNTTTPSDPRAPLPNYPIAVDPRSRMYDAYAIDCSPLPPDDPTAHQFMHCVDNKRGWPFWHDNGDRPYVENPAWPEYIKIDERGVLKVSVDDAVRLALLHSKDY